MSAVTAPRVGVIASSCANLFSVERALRAAGAEPVWVREPRDLEAHSHLVLPGVGAFDAGIAALGDELLEALRRCAATGRQILGICLGMQLLFEHSAEGGREGLGLLPGRVERLPEDGAHKVPHIGWNELRVERARLSSAGAEELWRGVADGAHVYFVHGYACLEVTAPWVVAVAHHGVPFAAAVSRGNVHGMQFHPEKSAHVGLSLLTRFLALRPLAARC